MTLESTIRKMQVEEIDFDNLIESLDEGLDEGRMKELHGYIAKGMSAADIAKKMGLDVKTIEALMDDVEKEGKIVRKPGGKDSYLGKTPGTPEWEKITKKRKQLSKEEVELDERSAAAQARRDARGEFDDKPEKDDDVATDADKKRGDENIINQLRKASDNPKHKVRFADGKSEVVDPSIVKAALKIFMQLKSNEKRKLQPMFAKSAKDLTKAVNKLMKKAQYEGVEEMNEDFRTGRFGVSHSLVDAVKDIIMGKRINEKEGDKEAYQKFFQKALKKFGVSSPSELKGDKEKEFYNYVDKNWTADHEESKKVNEAAKKAVKEDEKEHDDEDEKETAKKAKKDEPKKNGKEKVEVDPTLDEKRDMSAPPVSAKVVEDEGFRLVMKFKDGTTEALPALGKPSMQNLKGIVDKNILKNPRRKAWVPVVSAAMKKGPVKEETELDEGSMKDKLIKTADLIQKMIKPGDPDRHDYAAARDHIEANNMKTLKKIVMNMDTVPKEKIAVALAKGLGKAQAEKILGVKLNMSEEVELDEAPLAKRSHRAFGYELYHKDFSSAMQHAYKMAKKNYGITVDPKEIDDKVASGPRKPSEGKTNSYRLKGDKGAIQVQVYNKGGSKPFELNMYKEEVELDEAIKDYEVKIKVGSKTNSYTIPAKDELSAAQSVLHSVIARSKTGGSPGLAAIRKQYPDMKSLKKKGISVSIKEEVKEEMTEAQKEKREEIVKELKKKTEDFKKKYGDRWEDVMYATATKMAMKAA